MHYITSHHQTSIHSFCFVPVLLIYNICILSRLIYLLHRNIHQFSQTYCTVSQVLGQYCTDVNVYNIDVIYIAAVKSTKYQ